MGNSEDVLTDSWRERVQTLELQMAAAAATLERLAALGLVLDGTDPRASVPPSTGDDQPPCACCENAMRIQEDGGHIHLQCLVNPAIVDGRVGSRAWVRKCTKFQAVEETP